MNDPLHAFSRRRFLAESGMGFGSIALAWLLQQEQAGAIPPNVRVNPPHYDLQPKAPPAPPRATAMISLFMHGGPSHVDLMDPKPELSQRDGQDYNGEVDFSFVNRASKKLLGTPFKFQKHGQSGLDFSELLPHTASMADDLC